MWGPKSFNLSLSIFAGGATLCSALYFVVDEATNDLWEVSTATGEATRLMDLGIDVNEVAGLAYDGKEEIVYLTTVLAESGMPELFKIDYLEDNITDVMPLPEEIAGLTWDPATSTLIGIASVLDTTDFTKSKTILYEIDVNSKTLTESDVLLAGDDPILDSFVVGSLNGAAIDPTTGMLYATLGSLEGNDGVRLYRLTKRRPGYGYSAEILGTVSDGSEASQRWGLGFEPDSTKEYILYGVSGVDNSLYQIDKTDGSTTLVGPLGVNVGPAIGAAGGVPTGDRHDGSGGGDPHFHTFTGEYFGYHGICDLVMVSSESFGGHTGLDVHIRSVARETYSSISNVAIRIGEDVLEITNDETNYLNGNSVVVFPIYLAGKYPVHKKCAVESDTFQPDVSHGFLPEELIESVLYDIQIGHDEFIQVQLWEDYLWVNVRGSSHNFRDSVGLMGSYGSDRKMARNGMTVLDDPTEFAEEWQVIDTDRMLFQTARYPQHPSKCIPGPPTEVARRRRLGEDSRAKAACSNVTGPQHEFCIFDVLATDNEAIARVYEGMEKLRTV